MRRVLILSPHFPPDTGAASHRMRLLAPRLPEHGWEPTVVSVDPASAGSRIEPGLERFVHGQVRVERVPVLGGQAERFLGVGDLGLRALPSLSRRCRGLLAQERYDAILITLPPHYVAILGPWLHRATKVPYLLDYQDPWVSAWGLTVGGGPDGRPDWRSRWSRRLAVLLEPLALRGVAGLTAVSDGTLKGVLGRYPALRSCPRAVVPLGGDRLDFQVVRRSGRTNRFFTPGDGLAHLVYVGTLLPLGGGVLRALLAGAVLLRDRHPERFARVRLHFFGTSNQTTGTAAFRVLPTARELGLGEIVEEHPLRIDYLDALTVLADADAILLLGSTEPHYTASKVYPALLSRRPLIAAYHEASGVCEVLRQHGPRGATWLSTFSAGEDPRALAGAFCEHLAALTGAEVRTTDHDEPPDLGDWNASHLAGRLAECLTDALAR